jgi:hypothetical protein
MRLSTRFLAATAMPLILASPALADLTAAQAWERVQQMSEAYYGEALQVETVTEQGGVVEVRDAIMAIAAPDAEFNMTMPALTFTEQGDGTVLLTTPDEYTMRLLVNGPDGETVSADLKIRESGLDVLMSGDMAKTTMTYGAGEFTMGLENLVLPDNADVPPIFVEMAATGLAGTYIIEDGADGALPVMDIKANAQTMTLTANIKAPEGEEGFAKLDMRIDGLVMDSVGTMLGMAMGPMNGAMDGEMLAKVNAEGMYGFDALALDFAFEGDGDQATGALTMGAGAVEFSMADLLISYNEFADDMAFTLSGSAIPLPVISGKIARGEGGITMPLGKTPEATDYGLTFKMIGLEVNETIWSLFDPAQMLPRDPATLIVDLAGKGKLLKDMFDPSFGMGNTPPVDIETLNVKDLKLEVAGADLTGTGSFAFDFNAPSAFGAGPAVGGVANLKLVGGNGLLDTLVQMGLVDQDSAMGVRMMTSMIAVPGEGEDTLVSEIEITQDGQIAANGQRLK